MAAAGRQPRPAGNAAARGRRASTTRSSTRAPTGWSCRCCRPPTPAPTAPPCAPRRLTASTRCPTTTATSSTVLRVRAGDQPREPARRDHAAGAQPADRARRCSAPGAPLPAGPARRGGHIGAGARRSVRARCRRGRPNRTRWTTSVPPTSSTFPPSGSGACPVTNGEWRRSSTTAATTSRGGGRIAAGAPAGGGLRAPLFWNRRRHPHPLRPHRGHPRRRAGPARHVLRGRGVRGVGRRAAAHRAGVGEGLRLGPRAPDAPPVPVGRLGTHRTWPTSAATRCGPRRSAPTRRARRPTARSRCSATCGSGRPRRSAVARLHADDLRALHAAVLRRRLQGAARRILGGRARHPAAQLPQLGPSDPPADLLRRPLAWDVTDV